MSKPKKQKLFVIKKYIMAVSAVEALKKEWRYRPDDCWVDEQWRTENKVSLPSAIGFHEEPDYLDED